MNNTDPHKEWRLQQEINMMDQYIVDSISDELIKFLENNTNENIFARIGGKLTTSIPLGYRPNAKAITYTNKPLEPRIEITLSMALEIYRDAFAFPLISKMINEKYTDILTNLNCNLFNHANYTFSEAIPHIPNDLIRGPLAIHCNAMAKVISENQPNILTKNDINARFLLFELMFAWTYFHELSHILQQHYKFKATSTQEDMLSHYIEEIPKEIKTHQDLLGQAREILADTEGIHLTLLYLEQTGRLSRTSFYLLLCGISCMFQRFYNNYDESLTISPTQHPHPVVRNEFAHGVATNWIISYLLDNKIASSIEEAAPPISYSTVKATLITGIYRAHRIEKIETNTLPSFIKLSSPSHHEHLTEYKKTLEEPIRKQKLTIDKIRLNQSDALKSLLKYLENM